MAWIRSSTDLRNNYNEISSFCHKHREPVFITKNGAGDLAVMSMETYELLSGRLELYRLLDEGEEDFKHGRIYSAEAVFSELRRDMENGTL
ncbi:MAG: type II toxin-antitoxin system Phd/YefM family antitoxin [Clostridiales bacterium]|nr:type II toxin-antitoxin system Phd/YefM family antitoxin [Clostridiales bacterium]